MDKFYTRVNDRSVWSFLKRIWTETSFLDDAEYRLAAFEFTEKFRCIRYVSVDQIGQIHISQSKQPLLLPAGTPPVTPDRFIELLQDIERGNA
jgi:hypothetical protein